MTPKKIIVAVLLVLVLVGGFVAGLLLIRDRQEIREQAAVPDGDATASVFPTSGNFDVGDTFPVSIYFNTANIPVNGVEIKLVYPYSGATPELTASNIEINQVLLSSGNWTCPVRDITEEEGRQVSIEIACANIAADGFRAGSDTLLATFDLTVNRQPQTSPTVVRFDPAASKITAQATGADILLVPQSQGSYAIAQAGPVATVTVAQVPTEGPTSTPLPTGQLTATPTASATATPTIVATTTATASPTLMPSGVSFPTMAGIILGLIVILGSLMLAL